MAGYIASGDICETMDKWLRIIWSQKKEERREEKKIKTEMKYRNQNDHLNDGWWWHLVAHSNIQAK